LVAPRAHMEAKPTTMATGAIHAESNCPNANDDFETNPYPHAAMASWLRSAIFGARKRGVVADTPDERANTLLKNACHARLLCRSFGHTCEIPQAFLGTPFSRSFGPSHFGGFSAAC
jgi:hypothetical protein